MIDLFLQKISDKLGVQVAIIEQNDNFIHVKAPTYKPISFIKEAKDEAGLPSSFSVLFETESFSEINPRYVYHGKEETVNELYRLFHGYICDHFWYCYNDSENKNPENIVSTVKDNN